MIAIKTTRLFAFLAAAVAVTVSLSGGTARSQQLFYEDFEDETIATNGMINMDEANPAMISGGTASFMDTTGRSSYSVVQTFNDPVMTFSVDLTAPIVPINAARMEVIFRVGVGAGHGTLQNADHVIEAILFRGTDETGSRIGLTSAGTGNNGMQTLFMIYNNKATNEVFNSPIDGMPVTLLPFQYVPYMYNAALDVYTAQPKGVSNVNTGTAREITRFGIGSSTTGDQGTFALDNVLVMTGATFDRNLVSKKPGDVDDDMDVDLIDYGIIRDNFQKSVTMRIEGDLNNDGKVDFRDYRQWKANFVPPPGTPAEVAVPEPSSALLAAAAALAMSRLRSRR